MKAIEKKCFLIQLIIKIQFRKNWSPNKRSVASYLSSAVIISGLNLESLGHMAWAHESLLSPVCVCVWAVLHSFPPPLKVFQDRFGKFEPINNLSDRKLFHSYPVHLLLPLHSTPSSSLLVFQPLSQTPFITLTLLSGPASSEKHCPLLERLDS